ncbi:TonB-dependent receptor [Fulvivirgaceae bacterium BMA12]|uniref:TonB-dependent receptor n=1 Tax=Agaribacillus aureus TaxID=3051825 RepID=A0ABT8L6I9_9BACT|nr:TonB-dependent receptor [Fulvivirgaceae bacterium BMA12]
MKFTRLGLCLLLFFTAFMTAMGQSQRKNNFTISGYVKDRASGEDIIGATIYIEELKTGVATNVYGFYSITVPAGDYHLQYSFVGYKTRSMEIALDKDQSINIQLQEAVVEMEEIVISSERPEQNVTEVKMSTEKLSVEKIKTIPAMFGEVDIIRSMQLLPGVQSAGEGTTGLFVRGGAADQTLIQMDEATVYNPSHFLGFFSVFNPDAIKEVELYKGGIPARFGGRISSIMDIRMKEGNSKKFAASGGIGLISSRLTLEGPIVKDKSSFIVSGRRTYADVFSAFAKDTSARKNILYFYDLNMKLNYRFSDKDKLFVSGYFGRDKFKFEDDFGLSWGNKTGTVRWNHLFNNRLFLNTTLLFSDFDYNFDINDDVLSFDWTSNLREFSGKLDFTYFLNPNHQLEFGYKAGYFQFSPATIKPVGEKSVIDAFKIDKKYALEHGIFLSSQSKFSEKLSVEYGIRYSLFQNIGPATVLIYGDEQNRREDNIIDSVKYSKGDIYKTYGGLEPRIGARFMLNRSSSIKASYNRTRQYLQIASNSTAGLPIDRWVPSDKYIKPQISDQIAAGYFRNFKDNTYEFSVETYYKWMQNQIDFKDQADILLNSTIETELLSGKGWSYGVELLLKKNVGKTTGWIGYTWSKTRRQIDGINGGKAYRPRYDRPHDISVVVNHEVSPRVSVSANWVYATGSAVSIPKGKYAFQGQPISYYDPLDRNGDRMPAYHRMDLSITLKQKKKLFGRGQGEWNLSVYNAYMKKNPWIIDYRNVINGDPKIDPEDNVTVDTEEFKSVTTYLLKIIPSVSYNFKF